MIQMKNLTKRYRAAAVETTALHDITLHIRKGEFVSIMGPSGCGKSTLLNLMGLIDSPDAGVYRFGEQEVATYSERQRARLRKQHIGFVFQSFNLIDELTVFENVQLPLMYTNTTPEERRRKVAFVLEKLGMSHRGSHFPQQLSGGQQQRIAIARAFVNQPDLILADEPTGNLDSHNSAEVMDMLLDLNHSGATVIMVTHSPACASYGDRILRLLDGRIVAEQVVHA